MPVAIVAAEALGVTGYEAPDELEADTALGQRVESFRLKAGVLMGLGDVATTTVPKICVVAPPSAGGSLATRMFIPHRVHTSIGVLAAVTVATAAVHRGQRRRARAYRPVGDVVRLEHPTGWFDAVVEVGTGPDGVQVGRSAIVRTARLLLDGTVYPRPAKGETGMTPGHRARLRRGTPHHRAGRDGGVLLRTSWRWRWSAAAATASTCTRGTTTSASPSR